MAETGQCGARLRRIAGCKCTGFLLKTAFHRGRAWGSPLQKRLHFKQNDLKGYWKRRKEDIDLYTVKKDARPRLPVYSGWGIWPPHVGLVWDIQSQSSQLFRGRLTNTSRCPVSVFLNGNQHVTDHVILSTFQPIIKTLLTLFRILLLTGNVNSA